MIGLMRRSPKVVSQNRKLSVSLLLQELVIQPDGGELEAESAVFIEVKWKGPKAAISYLRKSQHRGKTERRLLSNVVAWNEHFDHECVLVQNLKHGAAKELCFQPWHVNLVFRKAVDSVKDDASRVLGTVFMDLADLVREEGQSELQKDFPFVLSVDGHEKKANLKIQMTFSLSSATTDVGEDTSTFVNPPTVTKDDLSLSDMDEDEDPSDPPPVDKFSERISRRTMSMGRINLPSFLQRVKTSDDVPPTSEVQVQPYLHSLSLSRIPSIPGEETEDEDPSLDESLRYWRLSSAFFGSVSLSSSIPTLLSTNSSEGNSPVSPQPVPETSQNTPQDVSAKQGVGLRFFSLPWRSVEASGSLSEGMEAGSDDEEPTQQVQGSIPSSKSLQIKVPSVSVNGFWGGKRKLGTRSPTNMEEPLLNKAYGEEGGDEIDWDRRQAEEAEMEHPLQIQKRESQPPAMDNQPIESIFVGEEAFSVGRWENRELSSRDGSAKLRTDLFFASIDQCHEKAGGGGACTSLVALLAEWLHSNPGQLPNRAEYDEIIKAGSAEWRELCEVEEYKSRFPDGHFDLETVLEAKKGRLKVDSEKSFVGFFQPEGSESTFLEGLMSFDSMWNELAKEETGGTYVVSWNDHFFLLVVRGDECFILDTLGQRLFEGCRQAYMLKFGEGSRITWLGKEGSKKEGKVERKGIRVCGQFIKDFLASVHLKEVQASLEKVKEESELCGLKTMSLHQRLQIELQYVCAADFLDERSSDPQ